MRRFGIAIIIGAALVLIIGLVFFIIGFFRPKVAGIYIETNPSASVYINGQLVGRTPYDKTNDSGEVIIRLVPESFQMPLAPYETKLTLTSGVKTVLRRDFGESSETSGGELISFEKIDKNQTDFVVVTHPDSAEIIIDGQERAFAPYKTSNVLPGQHQIQIKSANYLDRLIDVRMHQGYKLTLVVQLAISNNPKESVEPTPVETKEPMVEILTTPVGFLRVRGQPSTIAEEVAQVEPGERYKLLSEDEKTGWYKIEYEEGKEGWVSDQYVKKIEDGESSNNTATPSGTLQ